jgi:histidine kinase
MILHKIPYLRQSLTLQLIAWVGSILLGTISVWAFANIKYHERNEIGHMIEETDRLGTTIRLGLHYAMMINSRDDINQIINNIGRQQEIRNIRVFNKAGEIKFSSVLEEVERTTDIRAEACIICHRSDPPLETVPIMTRTRMVNTQQHDRQLGIISPIYNESGCSEASCHYHPRDKKVLGALDVVVSLNKMDKQIVSHEKEMIALAFFIFIVIAAIISTFFFNFVNRPIKHLITATRHIGQGSYRHIIDANRDDEIGQLANAVQHMGEEIRKNHEELNRQKYEYQNLFEQVPCYITVQDRDLRIITYNQETARQFRPSPGDYCYSAYKGRNERCEVCPVAQTFADGSCHVGEERVINRDGTETHLFVRTTPVRQSSQEITAVMEISLDITESKRLEKEIRRSEQKYQTIFNNIPNAVFVVDAHTMEILDSNESASTVYGFDKVELIAHPFSSLFEASQRDSYSRRLRTAATLTQVRQLTKAEQTIFVNMHISPSEYLGREAYLVVASDITQRLSAEQQLIQASKMATLGEMSAGVAHELNQPLAVIKTASTYLLKKARKREPLDDGILQTMAEEIDSHVNRAAKIINHLREFGRKSDVRKEPVQVNDAMFKASDMFHQQLKLKQINVIMELQEDLPLVLADVNRLEQVFINLLINARDAIEEKQEQSADKAMKKEIQLRSYTEGDRVTVEIVDSGIGIRDHIKDRIFEPFFTTKKIGQGTGLGLSISYGIVQDYDGIIRVASSDNEGSKFTIQFPAAAGA